MVDTDNLVKKLIENIKVRRVKEYQLRDNFYVKAKGGKIKYKYLTDDNVADICALEDLIKLRYFDNEKFLEVIKAQRFKFRFLRKLNLTLPDLLSELRDKGSQYIINSYERKMQELDDAKLKKQI